MSLYSQLVQHIANELTQEPAKAISRDHLHTNQLAILEDNAQFKVIVCGRRFGKTTLALHIIDEALAAGEKIWYCAVTHDSVDEIWLELAEKYKHEWIRAKTRTIRTSNGGLVSVKGLQNGKALRGKGLHKAIVDEAAFIHPNAWFEVIQPMLLDTDGQAFIMSSPKGKNWFYDVYTYGLDDTIKEWRSYHYTTFDNPNIKREAIERLKYTMTDRQYREEILAEFNDSDGAVFRNVRACAIASEQSEPVEGHNYVFGCDFARDNDYTVISVLDVNTSELVAIDRYNHVDYTIQAKRITTLYEKWKPLQVIAESNSIGAPMIDALRREGIPIKPFATTAKSKPLIIDSLALAFEQESIKILNHPILIHELTSYEQTKTPSGNMKFSAPEGGHDDCVVSLAIGWNYISRRTADEIPVISF